MELTFFVCAATLIKEFVTIVEIKGSEFVPKLATVITWLRGLSIMCWRPLTFHCLLSKD